MQIKLIGVVLLLLLALTPKVGDARAAKKAHALADPYAGRYLGTWTPNHAAPVPATATVKGIEGGSYEIVLQSRPATAQGDGRQWDGRQWRDYRLPGGIINGRFRMAFVSGQIVDPVLFTPRGFSAVVQGADSGGTFQMRRIAP